MVPHKLQKEVRSLFYGRCYTICFLVHFTVTMWLKSIPYVVYFDQLLGTVCAQKLVELLFSAVFNLFCSFQTFFSDFKSEINKKRLKKHNKKSPFLSTPQSWWTPWGGTLNLLFCGRFFDIKMNLNRTPKSAYLYIIVVLKTMKKLLVLARAFNPESNLVLTKKNQFFHSICRYVCFIMLQLKFE